MGEPDGRTVVSQRYTLQAAMSGTQRIPPLRIEFLDERGGPAAADDGDDQQEAAGREKSLEHHFYLSIVTATANYGDSLLISNLQAQTLQNCLAWR